MYDVLKAVSAILIAVVFLWLGYLFLIDIKNDIGKIDTKVETIDGKVYRCSDANPSRDGMTYMNRVNGKNIRLTIPSKNIKTITEIK
jgi:hypothetical protein